MPLAKILAGVLGNRWTWRAILAVGLMVAGSEIAGRWWYVPRIEAARQQTAEATATATQWQTAAGALQTALRDQAAAVQGITAAAQARDAAALEALTAAATLAGKTHAAAAAIAKSRPPPGLDACAIAAAARQAFADELARERQP